MHRHQESHPSGHGSPAQTADHGTATTTLRLPDLGGVCCAEAAERALRASPHVTDVKLDYRAETATVTYHAGMTTPAELAALARGAGCPCEPAEAGEATAAGHDGHDAGHLGHRAQLAPITQGTKQDRMQYELAATTAGAEAHAHHPAPAVDHAAMGHPPAAEPEMDHAAMGHGGMSHDMSDPKMAAAMERDMRNRFLVALLLTIPTVLYSPLGTGPLGVSLPTFGVPPAWIMLALSTPVVWWAGWIFIGGAWVSLKHRALNMSVLIATGVLAAYLFSLALTLLGGEEVFFEAAAMLVTFVLFGHWMEMKSRRGTTDALRALFDLVPPTATVLRDGRELELPTDQIVVGDLIRLRPGEKVAVDGEIESGETSIDESLVTGESVPVDKGPGDPVVGGSINRAGAATYRATKVGADTALGQIVRLVEQAQSSKAPGQRLADTAAQYLVVLAVGAGLLTFLAWYLFGNVGLVTALTFAISAVVIACPDALGLATPTAVAVGTGVGARHNILIKDAATLEGVSGVDAVVLDKTGTLTEGRPRLTDVVVLGEGRAFNVQRSTFNDTPSPEAELLRLVASAEGPSEHPLARAIVEGARERGLSLAEPSAFQSIAGQGLEATVDGRAILVGNRRLLERLDHPGLSTQDSALNTPDSSLAAQAEALGADGKTPMFVAVDGRPAGLVAVADTIKPSARAAVDRLRELGIEVVMMTGDNRRTAEAVARELGIERVFAEVLPGDKAEHVRRLQGEGKKVAMVGDGVNDAPALAQADVGIAIGAGTDVAIETARVVLMKSDPLDVVRAIRLSQATVTKMKQNLFWASIYNVLAIPVAAGVLYPSYGIMLRPEWSALLMSLSSIIVAVNAVLLKRVEGELATP